MCVTHQPAVAGSPQSKSEGGRERSRAGLTEAQSEASVAGQSSPVHWSGRGRCRAMAASRLWSSGCMAAASVLTRMSVASRSSVQVKMVMARLSMGVPPCPGADATKREMIRAASTGMRAPGRDWRRVWTAVVVGHGDGSRQSTEAEGICTAAMVRTWSIPDERHDGRMLAVKSSSVVVGGESRRRECATWSSYSGTVSAAGRSR